MNKRYDLSKLKYFLDATTDELVSLFTFGPQEYGFIDNDSSVLGVVHLDTVAMGKPKTSIKKTISGDTVINSINLDDRLGLWILLDVLPKMGVVVDVLLTDHEEEGRSTSMFFDPKKKKYNWMFQFDRRAHACAVLYQYESKEIREILEEYGFDVQRGTFSDISYLDGLGCVGINFGCGYVDEHTSRCMARLSWVDVAVKMFVEFFNDFKDIKMPYVFKLAPAYHQRLPLVGGASGLKVTTNQVSSNICPWCSVEMTYDEMLRFGVCEDCYMWEQHHPIGRVEPKSDTCISCGVLTEDDDLVEGYCINCLEVLRSIINKENPEYSDDDEE